MSTGARNPTITKRCVGNGAEAGCGRVLPHYTRKRAGGKYAPRAWCCECWGKRHRAIRQAYKKRKRGDKAYRKKERARNAALKIKVTKDTRCDRCGSKGVPLERHHHRGYEYPLDVQILCSPCHAIVDRWAEGRGHKGEA